MEFLGELDLFLKDRKDNPKEGSYSSELFLQGVDRIARKIGEEAAECLVAAVNNDIREMNEEGADLLFHLMMLLHERGSNLGEVVKVLKKRHK